MPKWRTTVVDPRNLEADNKRVWLLPQGGYKQLPQVVTKTLRHKDKCQIVTTHKQHGNSCLNPVSKMTHNNDD